jgi:hypothetical protein
MKQYKTKAGLIQYKPSIEEIQEMDSQGGGFCLACGAEVYGVEPDARRYVCECCGAAKVYGASELAIMGLVY